MTLEPMVGRKLDCISQRRVKLLLLAGYATVIFLTAPAFAADPIGNHDEATCTTIRGWTCDPDNYSAQLQVHFYRDAPYGAGGVFIGSTVASTQREAAVGSVCGNGHAQHGFSWPIPTSLYDKKSHKIYAYAINGAGTGTNPLLGNSGRSIKCLSKGKRLYLQPSIKSASSILKTVKTTRYALPLPPPADGIPHGATYVVFWRWQAPAPINVASAISNYTGFGPPAPLATYQIGTSNALPVSSVQVYGRTIGLLNVPSSALHQGPIMPLTVHRTYNPATTNVRPWTRPGTELGYRIELQVPFSETSGGTINYAQGYIAVIDSSTGKWFWVGGTMFDTRGTHAEWIGSEQGTPGVGNPIVASMLTPGTGYVHMGPSSSQTTSAVWAGWRTFEFRITYGELQQMITDIKRTFSGHANISLQPESYKLYGVFFLSEVYYPNSPTGRLGMSVRNMELRRY